MTNIRVKGATGEREVADALNYRASLAFTALGLPFSWSDDGAQRYNAARMAADSAAVGATMTQVRWLNEKTENFDQLPDIATDQNLYAGCNTVILMGTNPCPEGQRQATIMPMDGHKDPRAMYKACYTQNKDMITLHFKDGIPHGAKQGMQLRLRHTGEPFPLPVRSCIAPDRDWYRSINIIVRD